MGAEVVAHAIQLVLGIVFLTAVAPKLRRPAAFVRIVGAYQLVPRSLLPVVARGLLGVELLLALALVTGWPGRVAVVVAIATLLTFIAAVTVNLRRDKRIPCGCFGNDSELLSSRTVVRLILLAGMGLVLLGLDVLAGASMLTVDRIVTSWSGLAYGLEVAGVAMVLLLSGLWLFTLPNLRQRPAN